MAHHTTDLQASTSNFNKRFILVTESDIRNLRYIAGLLNRFGYQACAAENAREALELAIVSAPALIITALELEDMPGLQLVQHIKKYPAFTAVPFITLRRQGDLAGEKRSQDLGACDCLYQPVAPEKLYLSVQTATETRPRRCIRFKTILPVRVANMSPESVQGASTLDVSECGMFLRCAEPVEVNTDLSLQFDLYSNTIEAKARVIYSYRTPGGPYLQPGMGLEFTRIAPGARELIRRFVRNEITKDIAPVNA